ncbi:hypothetical protein CYMTET_45715 [Cymbomonas tetramitiformis]|uniref:Uncharacterized protein n=1 Tax=Cymbomonas tetramitiformis TaxID=36881 RepID=A0AAE0EYB5_9CHLO|nr:hypothetical protein CYMTET_45715 [Cymbomonas tetramitiformis]
MSKRQDKAKAPERPPGLTKESTFGELSEEGKPDGISAGEDSAALANLFAQQEARIDERQQQLFTQQDARMNELFKMVQALAHAVPPLAVANQNAGTGNAIACPEAAESSMSGSSVKSRVASGTVDVPLPFLTDMLKGFPTDQLYSGQEAENNSKWMEFRGKIVPSLRHPALSLLLTDTRELEDIKKDEEFSLAANQLFHDFLSRVTTRTANAVVRSYSTEADGVSAWRQLIKMRRSTGSAYFVRQVKALLDDKKRFMTLAPPLQGFLNAREVLDRVEEYACTSKFLPGGEMFHVASLEVVFVAMVLNSLNPAYVYIRTMFSGDELPSFKKLNDAVCDHYDNVIATSAAAMETGAGIVEDRRKQGEQKRAALLKRVPCPVCHMPGHSSSECFVTHEDKREAYLKKNPKRREAIIKRVHDYQKYGKLPNRAAAVAETEQHPSVDDTGEARHKYFPVAQVYNSFVYIDTLCTALPGRKLEPTQALWEAGREQHLGPGYQISPRQPWYTSDVQYVHSMFMSGSVEVLDRAVTVLEKPHFPVDGRVVSHKKMVCAKHVVAEQYSLPQRLLEKEPDQSGYDSGDSSHRGDVPSDRGDPELMATPDASIIYGIEQVVVDQHAWSYHTLAGNNYMPDLIYLSGSCDDGGHAGDDSDCSIPDLDSASDSDSDDGGYASDTMPDLVDASDSDEEDDVHSWQPFEGVGGIPSDDWASGLFCPSRKNRLCAKGAESGIEDYCSSDWYYDAPDLEDGSDSDDEDACELREGHPVGSSLALYVASTDNAADIFTRALPLTAFGGKVAVIDSGATKHIFNMVSDFGDDFDPASSSTFSVVQAGTVSSEGSGTVTFAKLDVSTGRAVGLQFTGAHCIPGQPFNLVSVVALEDAGFSVDFGARQISSGGVTFSFSRVGNQYIIYEDQISGTLDTYMACAAYHDDSDRDKTDWKFEEAGKHIEEHGPFTLELFASVDNHILDDYCTTENPCFSRDWAGKACYGNPPYEHDTILRCLQKALSDFARAPQSTKFLLVLPRWETASWWQFVSLFTIVHEYLAGEKIFSAPSDSCYNVENLEMCGESRVWVRETKWPVVVIYKDGHTVMKLDAKMLAHIRLGHIGDVTMQEMLDEEILWVSP